ncbi:MAG: ATP-binding protein [Candidatus Omnitrophica bacterium]|nr:ATP-binding protein [Candidatus Omnitrophota bacterium]
MQLLGNKPIRVLLVEDDAASARLLQARLFKLPMARFELVWTGKLEAALERLNQEPFEAVLLDLSLPDSDGLDTFARVHSQAPTEPIIVLTGLDDDSTALEAIRLGAQDYWVKGEAGVKTLARIILYAIERKRAEEVLRESEQRYKHLLELTTDYIFTTTVKDGQVVSTSHSPACLAVTGYTSEEYAADPVLWYRMVHEEDRPAVVQQAAQVLAGKPVAPIEHRIHHKNGSIRWVKNTTVPRKDDRGRVIACDGLISDITERIRLQEERERSRQALVSALKDLQNSHRELKAAQLHLIQAEKMDSVGTLAAGVAHQVKNPLQILLLGVRYLANNLSTSDERINTILTDMRKAVTRADNIIRGLLEFSASNQLAIKATDINEVIQQALWLVNYELAANRIRLVKELAPHLPALSLDKIKMEQVIINLVMNAIQAMPQGGSLTVKTAVAQLPQLHPHLLERTGSGLKSGDTVVMVTIEDTGPGIPEDALTKIFDPFYTTKPPGKGTGLGLTVVKKIIELHGGLVDVRNCPQGGVQANLFIKPQSN